MTITYTRPICPEPEDSKPTNPKDAIGIRKVGLSCVPAPILMELGAAMIEGGAKYGRYNWRDAGVRSSVYYDAVWRHIASWWEGEDIDPDSGLPHIVKAMACLAIMRDADMAHMLNDDRPKKVHADGWIQALNDKAAEILDRVGPSDQTEKPA